MTAAKLILFSVAMAFADQDGPRTSVDIDFSHRLEATFEQDKFKIEECFKSRCKPVKDDLAVTEVKALKAGLTSGSHGRTAEQFISDLAFNLSQQSNPDKRVIVGAILNSPTDQARTALYYLKSGETVSALIQQRAKALGLKDPLQDFILRKVCDEGHCRPFTGINEESHDAITEIRLLLKGSKPKS